ncbi:cytochrome o ubiquinol oxidase subunit IV [Xylella fastidiosa subsp. pauca]|uniref:cytochrome o ubiquinol oxidase subunit IV n=1 Tax=Xylella fastidiosa TaxID=2371 RepID=UPI00058334B4|nr:cytochrome o ubiquinol oxidase subunit IV [Xylella fastidiosa]ARO68953.1 cytochrome o ubiquinol oxidase subunit IV [Xylella fastidiosa subsp. pauca]AVI21011.1 cytochrome o ubiquinol oxidase subunit IV [Xylella fastidiosa]AVI23037.1 cytochrome o ubiquinol oxidase subunit IV [Xylella fastidiosa]KIA58143.1 cytochrome C oxidase [Xylella fastidiosa]KXB10107.1 cytochrome o ubiquinol oxidase subunit IV [Xylella fastidiosa]
MSHHPHHSSEPTAPSQSTHLKSYLIGFVLAVILTAIPFAIVMNRSFSKETTVALVSTLAAVQMLVHLVYFLHMDRSKEQRSNVHVALFSLLVIGIVIVGSLWVMHNLNIHMMY